MAPEHNGKTLRRLDVRALVRRPRVVAPVGVGIVALAGLAISRFHPPPRPAPPVPPVVEPPPSGAAPPPVRVPGSGIAEPPPPVPVGGRSAFDIEIELAATSSVAGQLLQQAEVQAHILCRAVTFCSALDAYETVLDLAESLESCGTSCAAAEARAASRVSYIKSRLPTLANSVGCAAGADICACVGLLGGADCRP